MRDQNSQDPCWSEHSICLLNDIREIVHVFEYILGKDLDKRFVRKWPRTLCHIVYNVNAVQGDLIKVDPTGPCVVTAADVEPFVRGLRHCWQANGSRICSRRCTNRLGPRPTSRAPSCEP